MKPTKHARTNYKLLLPLLTVIDAQGGRHRFESSGYMPLSLEPLGYTDYKGRPVYSLLHFEPRDLHHHSIGETVRALVKKE